MKIKTNNFFFLFLERARQGLTLLVSPSGMENQDYVVLWIRLFVRLIFLFVTFLKLIFYIWY